MNNNEVNLSKKNIKGIIGYAVYLIMLYVLIKYITNNTDILDRLMSAPKGLIIIGIITTVLGVTLNAFLDTTCARVYGVNMPIADAIVFSFIAAAVNIVLPLQMGSVVKAIYYKKKLSLTYSRYLSIVSGTLLIYIMVTFVILIFSLLGTMIEWNIEKKYVIAVFILFLIGMATIIIAIKFQEWILMMIPFKKYTRPVLVGFFEIFANKRAMFSCSINRFVSMVLGGIRFVTIFMCLGVPTGFVNGMLYYGLYCSSSMIPILPGNIGISEAVMGVMNLILASDFDAGVSVVLVDRIYYYITTIMGAVLFVVPAWVMYKKVSEE